jgi:hypothetical protein
MTLSTDPATVQPVQYIWLPQLLLLLFSIACTQTPAQHKPPPGVNATPASSQTHE